MEEATWTSEQSAYPGDVLIAYETQVKMNLAMAASGHAANEIALFLLLAERAESFPVSQEIFHLKPIEIGVSLWVDVTEEPEDHIRWNRCKINYGVFRDDGPATLVL